MDLEEYKALKALVAEKLRKEPRKRMSFSQRVDWAYANAKLSNPDVTREMAERAVEEACLQGLRETLDRGLADMRPISSKEAYGQVERARSGFTVSPKRCECCGARDTTARLRLNWLAISRDGVREKWTVCDVCDGLA